MGKDKTKWYISWFDTKYYHILYKDRGYEEAEEFMRNLTSFLQLKKGSTILDLACGKGRHSVYLHQLGYKVTGVDLSPNSIQEAQKSEKEDLIFQVHDMCLPLTEKFDGVFNLFTSFGYFEDEEDNLRTIKAIKEELEPNGYGVIDFMNVHEVIKNLVPQNTQSIQGIDFHLERYVEDGFIYKDIQFTDEGESFKFQEKVKAISLEQFKTYFEKAGLQIKNLFGDYHLNEFHLETSPRLILIFEHA
ncbi:class I SAM-dependent methyltransferase [Mesonia sp. MT50]|uniref:Class I SAM-dependent methyltransferase n=1 Tax=Mesonia profundi TaxID=3070998 RepID=A0ABU1A2D2_9FLAO|nr:class I SAM-dependent methyltransferase [Mesonia profundi]MDQ7917421.1 class I SAM-dependent methyltransferase [Mesonia profundi]